MSRLRGSSRVTSRSPMWMLPDETSTIPASICSIVDLPQPEGPTSTMNSPSRISRSTLSTASGPSLYLFVSPWMRIGGIGLLCRARDLLEANGSVDVESAALRGADGQQLGGDHGGERAEPLRAGLEREHALARRGRVAGLRDHGDVRVAIVRGGEHLALGLGGRRRQDREQREAGVEHRDRAVQEVGGRGRLGGDAGELLDLERRLERRRVVGSAPDDRE